MKIAIPTLALAFGLASAVPVAMAQDATSGDGKQAAAREDTRSSQAQDKSRSGQSAQSMAMTQKKLKSQLEQAGFTDVQIVDAAYLVHAKGPDGDMVVMYIDPPVRTTTSAADGTRGESGARQGSSSPSKQ